MLQEIKGKLARLLATENLIVEHRNVETAQFDVVRRVLTLPIWDTNSEDVYDLLVAHEVGHALYTDDREWNKNPKWSSIPRSYVNITEDARIEKLMKRRYAGLNKTFYRGYSTLSDLDFFEIGDQDPNDFSFPDIINLYFKIGSYIQIKFSPEEQEIVDLINSSETFDEAIDAALEMSKFMKRSSENKKKPDMPIPPQQNSTVGSGEDQQVQEDDEPSEEEKEWFTDDDPEEREPKTADPAQLDTPSYEQGENRRDEEAQTVKSLEDNLKSISKDQSFDTPTYLTFPKMHMDQIIAKNKDIHEYIHSFWATIDDTFWEKADSEYAKFKKESQKEVNYMVKEFECKKSASNYARATTSRTGVLDMGKLHTYKYNDDLFKKVTVIPDGKNHGLIFVLDWSGSMGSVILNTLKQLYNLILFCRKTNIPYDVYAFTNEWWYRSRAEGDTVPMKPREENTLYIADDFAMMNLLTSDVNNSTAEEQMKTIWRICYGHTYMYGGVPMRLSLSGTPLNEAIMSLHKIIPEFQKKTGAEKVNCVVLTDGEANPCSRIAMVKRNWEVEPDLRCRRIHDNCFLRNRSTGVVSKLSPHWCSFTKNLLDNLKETYPSCNLIGFRILDSGLSTMLSTYISNYDEREQARKSWKKERTFTIKDMGYESYFVLAASTLASSVQFEVQVDASKSQIKNAFKKSLSGKKMNKRILGEFVQLVA